MLRQIVKTLVPAIFAATGFLFAGNLRAGEDAAAKEIAELAGVKTGLCLHLGCGRKDSPGLIAALAAKDGLLVHGLALDGDSLARARAAIVAAGAAGRATAEMVEPKPLPYLPDLANVAVVEDMAALAERGITREEVLRVVAPGGALCFREGGKWAKTLKPRPEGMDDWTHPQHGPDGNLVSNDKVVRFPLGFRWIDGLPMNLNRWASCRAWIIAGGRVFTLSVNHAENLGQRQKPHFLAANDAWNGMPLWKINCETSDDGAFLMWVNTGALATDGRRVYAATKTNAIGVEADSGKVAVTFPTKYPPVRLILMDGVLVASCWETKEPSKADFDPWSLWATWVAKGDAGSVEAYDAETGQPKWSLQYPALTAIAADGTVYLLTQTGNPPTERQVVAVEIATGKERWRAPHSRFGGDCDLQLSVAGKGYVVVAKRGDAVGLGAQKRPDGAKPREKAVFVLSAADGSEMWQVKPVKSVWTPVVDGTLWLDNKKHDLKTGKQTGGIGWGLGEQRCTPQAIVNGYLMRTRGGQYVELPREGAPSKDLCFRGARGGCIEGMVPANGMLYTSQNNCRCTAGQVYGFIAIGPCGEWPKAEDFEKARPVEKGPAFGAAEEGAPGAEDWPMFRHDAERSAATAAKVPKELKEAWKAPVVRAGEGAIEGAWRSRIASRLSAPVAAGGRAYCAATDEGRAVALDAATGAVAWSVPLGGRVDTPPTIHGGLCLIGCHDGWVYALRAKDGQLAWRTRVAPWERRMVAYGAVESVWPAVGTVLVHENVAYVNAGRTSESDGGIAVVALSPSTGAQVWGKAIAPGPQRQNDLLALRDGAIGWWHVRLDPKTGGAKPPADAKFDLSQGGMMDGAWTLVGDRRSGKAFRIGMAVGNLLAWNGELVAGPGFAVARAKTALATGAKPDEAMNKADYSWTPALPDGAQVEAMAMTGDAVFYAGRTKGKASGFLCAVSVADGKKTAEFPLDAPPTYDGLAVAGGKVYVSLQNGMVACFGK